MLKSLSMLSMLTSSGDKYALASVPIVLSLLQNHNGKVGELYGRNPVRTGGRAVAGLQQFLAQYAHHQPADHKEAESTFRLAGAGVENYENTIAGTESKLSMLGQKLTQQQRAVEQYSRALVAANDKLMIIARLVERIDIGHDYEIEIKFRISVEQYMRIAA